MFAVTRANDVDITGTKTAARKRIPTDLQSILRSTPSVVGSATLRTERLIRKSLFLARISPRTPINRSSLAESRFDLLCPIPRQPAQDPSKLKDSAADFSAPTCG